MNPKRRAVVQGLAALSVGSLAGCGETGSGNNTASQNTGTKTISEVESTLRVAFDHGIASGDPLADRVILWTRVTPVSSLPEQTPDIPVLLKVATDQAMSHVVATYHASATLERDFCVKVDADGLSPNTWYYYQFQVGNQVSGVGRTRTLPDSRTYIDRARFAVVSCSNFPYGYFSAYRAVADHADLDFILHLGDYIYEYGPGEYGDHPDRPPMPPHEIISLDDYRQRHAQYKTDEDLLAVHQQYPMICIWDDHETADNSYRDGAENHDPATEGDWEQRKAAAIQAYYEWMPVREINVGDKINHYRRFQFGDLIDLFMLDTRLEDRDEILTNPADPERNSSDRHLISETQMNWLLNGLDQSSARWRMLGQQVMFAQLNIAEIPGIEDNAELRGNLVALNMDQWDGYAADRQQILNYLADQGIGDVVIFTGDIHTSWANEVYRNPAMLVGDLFDEPLAAEFVTPAVTSPGLPEEVADLASVAIPVANPHIKYTELKTRGFQLVDVTRARTQVEFYYVSSIDDYQQRGQLNHAKTKVVAVNHGSSRIVEDLDVSRARSLRTALFNPPVAKRVLA